MLDSVTVSRSYTGDSCGCEDRLFPIVPTVTKAQKQRSASWTAPVYTARQATGRHGSAGPNMRYSVYSPIASPMPVDSHNSTRIRIPAKKPPRRFRGKMERRRKEGKENKNKNT